MPPPPRVGSQLTHNRIRASSLLISLPFLFYPPTTMRLVAFLAAILLTVGVGECLVGLACDRGRRAGGRRAPAQGRGAGGGGGSATQRQQLRATPAPTTHGPRPHTDLSLLSLPPQPTPASSPARLPPPSSAWAAARTARPPPSASAPATGAWAGGPASAAGRSASEREGERGGWARALAGCAHTPPPPRLCVFLIAPALWTPKKPALCVCVCVTHTHTHIPGTRTRAREREETLFFSLAKL